MAQIINNDNPPLLNRCAIYARYSSSKQREASIEDQIRKCREYAARHNFIVVEEYVRFDEKITGADFAGRVKFQSLLAAAERRPRPFNILLFDDTSRFARDAVDHLGTFKELQFNGIRIISISQGLDSNNPGSKFSFGVHAIMDEEALVELGNRVRRGLEGIVLEGKYIAGGRCYGYKNIPDEHPTKTGDWGRPLVLGVKRVIDREEAEVVKRIFGMYADGLSMDKIAQLLRSEGVPAPRPPRRNSLRGWSADGIRSILRNEIYIGIYLWNRTKGERHPKTRRMLSRPRPEHEWVRSERPEWQIISDELWNRVQAQLALKKHFGIPKMGGLGRTRRSQKYLFSGLLYCGLCGRPITIIDGCGDVVWYGCSTWRYKAQCTNSLRIRRDSLEDQVLLWLTRELLQSDRLDRASDEFHAQIQKRVAELQAEARERTNNVPDVLKQLAEEREHVRKIIEYIAGAGARAPLSLLDDLAKREKSVKELEERLAHIKDIGPIIAITQDQIRKYLAQTLNDLQHVFTNSAEAGRQILQRHIRRIVLTPDENEGKRVYRVATEFCLGAGDVNADVLLPDTLDRFMQQYAFSAIAVTGLTLDTKRVYRRRVR